MNEMIPGTIDRVRMEATSLPAIIPDLIRPPAMEQREFGLPELFGVVRRRAKLISAVIVVAVAAGVTVGLLEKPQYTASALLMISPKKDRVVTEQQALSQQTPDSVMVDSEIEVLRSPAMASRLVTEMGLEKDPEWNPALAKPSLPDTLKSMAKGLLAVVAGPKPAEPLPAVEGVDLATVKAVTEAIKVKRRGLTYVMEVGVNSQSAEKAALMSNALASIYVSSQKEAQVATADDADVWLRQRVDELRAEVEQKQKAASVYRVSKGLLTAEGASLTEQQIADVQRSVLVARADVAEKRARYAQLKDMATSGRSNDSLAPALQSEVIRELRVKEATVIQRQADLESRYGPSHPEVENVRKERADVESLIRAEVSRIAANLANELSVSEARLNTMEASLSGVRGDLVKNNSDAARLTELEADAASAREVYESFQKRLHEVSNQGAISPIESRIVSAALPPTSPSSPNVLMAVALAGVFGIGLAAVLVFIAEQFRDTINSPEEVENKIGASAIATIPKMTRRELSRFGIRPERPLDYLAKQPMSAYAESFRGLRNAVMYSMLSRTRRVVAITSALAGEGKTICAVSLAQISALSGQRVVLVDCDLRRNSLNAAFGLSPKMGLVQVLADEVDWQSVIEVEPRSGLHVLPVADGAFTARDVFGSEAMDKLIQELTQAYDLVVLDCAPVLALAETSVLVAHADATVVVCRWGKTPSRAVRAALDQLEVTHARVLGVVVNAVDPATAGRATHYSAMHMSKASQSYFR